MTRKNFYVRATGDNRFGQGTSKWLKIRSFTARRNGTYSIGVFFRGQKKFLDLFVTDPNNIEFAEGWPSLKPVSWHTVRSYYGNRLKEKLNE